MIRRVQSRNIIEKKSITMIQKRFTEKPHSIKQYKEKRRFSKTNPNKTKKIEEETT